MTFDEALKALGVDPNSAAADLIVPRPHAGTRGAMWDAANKEKRRSGDDADGAGKFKNFDQLYNDRLKGDPAIPGNDNDGAGKFKNFDQLWNDRLKDDPAIPKAAKAGLEDLPHRDSFQHTLNLQSRIWWDMGPHDERRIRGNATDSLPERMLSG